MSEPATLKVILAEYSKVKGFSVLVEHGNKLLGLALCIYLLIELYKHITRGEADFYSPILRIGSALLVLNSIEPIGSWLSRACLEIANLMTNGDLIDQAASVWQQLHDQHETFDSWDAFTNPMFWMYLFTKVQLWIMQVIKIVVIEILWPVLLGVVLFSGALSIPITVMPGAGGSVKSWVMNLVEIGIWPITFQILVCLLLICYQGEMEHMKNLSGLWHKIDQLEEAIQGAEGETKEQLQAELDSMSKSGGDTWYLLKFWALNVAFGFLCIFTPFLSRMIVRGESVGFVGGVAAAIATRFTLSAPGKAGRAGKWVHNKLKPKEEQHPGGGQGVNNQGKEKSDAARLDQRD